MEAEKLERVEERPVAKDARKIDRRLFTYAYSADLVLDYILEIHLTAVHSNEKCQ